MKKTRKRNIIYFISTIGLAVGSFVAIPKIAEYIDKYNNRKPFIDPDVEEDWEPEIVKTSELTKEKENE